MSSPAPAPAPVTATPVASPPASSSGWTWPIWWSKNKARMKSIVMLGSGATTATLAAIHITMTGPWAILLQGLVGIGSLGVALLAGLACDWIDYRYTSNPA